MKRKICLHAAPTAVVALLIFTVLVSLTGCGGVTEVNTDVNIPDIDRSSFNDDNYQEGWRNLKIGKPAEAIIYFQKSGASREKLHVGFGYAYLAQNKMALARKNFDNALQIDPENLQAHFGLATMFEILKDKDAAFRIYAKLRAVHPENTWVKVRYDLIKTTCTEENLKQAEVFKNTARPAQYIEALSRAAEYSPEMTAIHVEIADFYFADNQFKKAAVQYEKVLEKIPNDETILLKLGTTYENLEKFDSAVLIYKKMLEFKPGDIQLTNRINQLKMKFYEVNLPVKFKNIFFKEEINREEMAALIGYYFEKYFEPVPPVIITDIGASFAKDYIIKVCSLNIMSLRPDHSFGRFLMVTRTQVAVVLEALIKYLEGSGTYSIVFNPVDEIVEPADISPMHRDYKIIKFLVNSRIMNLDEEHNFNPTQSISPTRILDAVKKILNSIREN